MPQIINLSPIGEVLPGDSLPIFDESNGDTRRVSVSQLSTYMENTLSLPDNAADIDYDPAGTGAVQRSVQSKLRDVVSVKDFGAVGDGVTDDTAAIQAAITGCMASGKALYVPTGSYLLQSQLSVNINNDPISRGFKMYGEGENSKFIINHTGTGLLISCVPSFQLFKALIEDLYFTDGALHPARMIHNNGAVNTVISNCYFIDATVTVGCVVNDNAYGLSLQGCAFVRVVGTGVLYAQTGSLATYSYVNSIIDCDFTALSVGIAIQGVNSLYVASTVIEECTAVGVYANPIANSTFAFNITFDGCWFERNAVYDLQLLSNINHWCEASIRSTQFSGPIPGSPDPCRIELGAKSKVTIDGCIAEGNTVVVSGSANASAILIRSTNFSQSGSFNWTSIGEAGITTTVPITTTNAAGTKSTQILSEKGVVVDPASGTATTAFAVTAGRYEVAAYVILGAGTPAAYAAFATVICDGVAARISANNGTDLTLTLSGLNVQVRQTTGTTNSVQWSYTKLALI